jgi:iron complex outermembrane receptor protein
MKNALAQAVHAALCVSACLSMPAWAQQATSPPEETRHAATDDAPVKLDTVTVTATRREASMQSVPISVSAVSAQALAASNVREATDLQYLVPNLTFSSTESVASGGGFQIRGIGTQAYDAGLEQSVGMVVDGVVIGLPRDPGPTGFGDIDRVEVLRGPQGTLFGKNSSAGVIQIVTRDPQMGRTEGEGTVMLGERNEHVARAALNLPLGETVALRLAGFYTEQDGAIPYVLHDHAIGDRRNSGLRAKLLWWASDDLSLLFSAEHQDGFSRSGYTIERLGTPASATDWATILYNAQFAGFATKPGPGVYKAYHDGDWTADVSTDAASLKLDYTLESNTLTSITAWRRMKQTQLSDLDASPSDMFDHSDGGLDSHQFTQEVRLTSPSGGRVEYVLGAFYYRTDVSGWVSQYGNYYNWLYCGLGQPLCGYMPQVVFGGGRRGQAADTRSAAVFGEATWALSERVKLVTGARYTRDKVSGSLWVTPLAFPTVALGTTLPYDGSVSGNDLSGRVGLQWQPSEALMLYATYARGYKGPAIEGSTGVVREVRPEKVDSYELGLKSTLLDGAMIFNLALYQSDFKDFQAQALDVSAQPPVFALTNAGHMRARGIELESSWQVTRGLRLGLNGALSDATYRRFVGACYTYQPVVTTPTKGMCYQDPVSGLQSADYAGDRLANAPRRTYGLTADYRRALGRGLAFDAGANWSWRSDTYSVTGDDDSRMAAFGILNANLGIGRGDGRWRVGVYARNLLDKHFYAVFPGGTLNPGGYFRMMPTDAFRTVGVTLGARF